MPSVPGVPFRQHAFADVPLDVRSENHRDADRAGSPRVRYDLHMRGLLIGVFVAACGAQKPTSAPPPPTTTPCDCRATCACHGTDDPDADQYTLEMLNTCAKTGVTCPPCPDCLAPAAE